MAVGGGVSQNPQLQPKLRIARRAECDPTSDLHTQATSSRKGRRTRECRRSYSVGSSPMRTSILPKLPPLSISAKAAGMTSRPSRMSSR
jgi:hypothetical protein